MQKVVKSDRNAGFKGKNDKKSGKLGKRSKRKNMYALSVKQWSPFKGCNFRCKYCKSSFQAQAKRQKWNCSKCYTYEPHEIEHESRLTDPLPKTGYMQFIFTCASGDVSYCSTVYLNRILDRIRQEPDKTFLLQSKNPATFNRVKLPANVIIGTTIETNRADIYKGIAKAPSPEQRYLDLRALKHPTKMVTIEPVMQFDLDVMLKWITEINPVMVWLGYDSKNNHLPEPELSKVKELYWELGKRGFTVMLKTIKEN